MTPPLEPRGRLAGNDWSRLDGLEPDAAPSVTVIIAHYRQPVQLARMLRAIERQDFPAEAVEVIVVDDGSPEPPVVPPGVQLLTQLDDGFRLAAARNRGAAAARNDVLVFLDADTAPEPDYLRRITRLPALAWDCVTVGRRRHADLDGLSTELPIELIGPQHELPEPAWLLDAYRESGDLLRADDRSYRHVIGAVIACTRRFFVETGGFDEGFTSYGGEDWEWAYRAWRHGAVLAHVPDAVAWHDGPDRAGREPHALAPKNIEAMRLAALIPVPGSRPRGSSAERADIVVVAPRGAATPGQVFVSVDSVLAAVPGAEPHEGPSAIDGAAGDRFDRVRVEIVIERPLRVHAGGLDRAMTAIESGAWAEVVVDDGSPLLRLVSRRAAVRQARWGGEPLLPTLRLDAEGVAALPDEVDVEGYLAGW